MPVTFTQIRNTIDLAEKVKVDAGEKIVRSEKIGKSKKVDLTVTTKGGKFYAYFDGEKYAGAYADDKAIDKLAKDYLKLVGESVIAEVRGKAGSSDGDEEADKNIIMQLRKVVSLRGMKPVTFENGKTLKVDPKDAQRVLDVFSDLRPQSKMQLQTVLSKSPEMFKKALSQLNVNEYFDSDLEENNSAPRTAAHRRAQMTRNPSKSGGTGYDLYHKDFSSAMKHAYDYAKKKFGIEVDPKEIDDKVASGPRKPSKGKTNSYRLLDKDGKKAIQVQVYGMDNGKYELNMYKESVDLEEAYKTPSEAKAYEDGKKAVRAGTSYDNNPNKKGSKEYTAWSKGHNDARAKMIGKRFSKENIEEAPEDQEPASPDELQMALKQLEFIAYASDEISMYLNKMGKFPEWMQNKLATINDNMQSLHSQIDHEKLEERELTDKELADREKIAKKLPDDDFKSRYGDRWMQVKMAVATDLAKKKND